LELFGCYGMFFTLLRLISSLSILLGPLFILPIILCFDYYLLLRISLSLSLWHFLLFFTTRSNLSKWGPILEFPMMILFTALMGNLMPKFIEIAYGYTLQYLGPALVLFEGVQVVFLLYSVCQKIFDSLEDLDEQLTPLHYILLVISGVVVTLCGFLIYGFFTNPKMTVPLASWVSMICTILFVISAVSMFQQKPIIPFVPIFALFLVFCIRLAFDYVPIHIDFTPAINPQPRALPTRPESSFISTIIFQVLKPLSFGGIVQRLWGSLQRFFTLHFMIEFVLFLASIGSFFQTNHAELSRGRVSMGVGVMLYTYLILVITANILPTMIFWRVLQTALSTTVFIYLHFFNDFSTAS